MKLIHQHANGMTLIELVVGLAIASLMTITGWRAIDGLQAARDQTVSDAARWQGLDTLFATLEADMRRAELTNFSGGTNALTLQIPGATPANAPIAVRYVVAAASENGKFNVMRESQGSSLTFAEVRGAAFEYRRAPNAAAPAASDAFEKKIDEYPRAIQLTLAIVDNNAADAAPPRTVTRLMVLR
jgi:prepilin-type N-terminal cleavage/methylation domain-containing protein